MTASLCLPLAHRRWAVSRSSLSFRSADRLGLPADSDPDDIAKARSRTRTPPPTPSPTYSPVRSGAFPGTGAAPRRRSCRLRSSSLRGPSLSVFTDVLFQQFLDVGDSLHHRAG